jgi:hypothetical protein
MFINWIRNLDNVMPYWHVTLTLLIYLIIMSIWNDEYTKCITKGPIFMYLYIKIDIIIGNRLLAWNPQILLHKGCCPSERISIIQYHQSDYFQRHGVEHADCERQFSEEYATFPTCATNVLTPSCVLRGNCAQKWQYINTDLLLVIIF